LALTALIAIAAELNSRLPAWAINALIYCWFAVLAAAAYDAWREKRRDRAARVERERYGWRRSSSEP
jgi:hypothetical protein